jgi:hypothetical protein
VLTVRVSVELEDRLDAIVGRDFLDTCDLYADALLLFERGVNNRVTEPVRGSGLHGNFKIGHLRHRPHSRHPHFGPEILRRVRSTTIFTASALTKLRRAHRSC